MPEAIDVSAPATSKSAPLAVPAPRTVDVPAPRHKRALALDESTPEVTPPPYEVTPPPQAAPALAPDTEAQLVASAFTRLRQAHDPAGALTLLDRRAAVFPRGLLEPEAMRARIAARQADASDASAEVLDQQLQADPGPFDWHRIDASGELDRTLMQARQALGLK